MKDIQCADRGLVHRQDPEGFRAGAGRGGPGELIGPGPPTSTTAGAARCGIFAVDDDGVIRAWNRGAADLLGWSEDLAVGRRLGEILVPPALLGAEAGDRSIIHSSLTGDRTWTVAVRRRDGTKATVLLDVAAVDAGGRRLMVGLIRPADATSRPATPAADLLQILFERAPETITITDGEGRQRLVNSAGLRLVGRQDLGQEGWP